MPSPRTSQRKRWLRGLLSILAAFSALGALVASAVVVRGLDDRAAKADLIVVPGTTIAPDGTPSPRLRARLDAALRMYREGWAPRIMVSGGTGVEGFDEAASMAAYLSRQGVPAGVIVQDGAGVDTASTARHAAEYLERNGLSTAIVATQYFHVARTELLLRRENVKVTGRVHARYVAPRDLYSIPREVVALAVIAFG